MRKTNQEITRSQTDLKICYLHPLQAEIFTKVLKLNVNFQDLLNSIWDFGTSGELDYTPQAIWSHFLFFAVIP